MTRDENGRRGGPGKRPDRPRSDKGPPRRTAGGKPAGRPASSKRAVSQTRDASVERHGPASAPDTVGRPVERQRIAKLMARVGLCSRRDAEVWIEDGRVELNGTVLTSPATDVGPDDKILVDGLPLPDAEKTRLFLFHKPRGLVTSDHDPEGRDTVADYLRETWPDGPRVVTIGRLDINTEGLLLLTNDGGLARVLELPTTGWVRRYRVRAKGETDQAVLDRLRDGVTIEGIDYVGIEAKLDRVQGANSWLTMGLREGKNREIKRVLEHIGLEVNRLIRLSFGPFQLLDLPEGKVEEVKTRILRDQLGETLAAEAGVDFHDADAPIVAAPAAKPAERTSRRAETRPDRDRSAAPARRSDASPRPPRDGGDRPRSTMPRTSRDNEHETEERVVTRPRKHVSTLRATEASDKRSGPRKRIERADTLDANNRAVKVERLVRVREVVGPAEAPRAARRGAGRFAARDETDGRPQRRESREATPRRGQGAHASPSAMAKRERVFRSGGAAAPARGEPRDTKDRSRDFRDREDRPTAEARAPRREASERPRARPDGERAARSARPDAGTRKPFTATSASDRPARDKRGSDGKPSGDRPQRGAPRSGAERGSKSAPRTNAKPGAKTGAKPGGKPGAQTGWAKPGGAKPKGTKAGGARTPGASRSGAPRSGPPRGKAGGGPKR